MDTPLLKDDVEKQEDDLDVLYRKVQQRKNLDRQFYKKDHERQLNILMGKIKKGRRDFEEGITSDWRVDTSGVSIMDGKVEEILNKEAERMSNEKFVIRVDPRYWGVYVFTMQSREEIKQMNHLYDYICGFIVWVVLFICFMTL
jgi:hypothetical protein